eukprot:1145836-Pelagomonas_calceolata.AAC.26
MRRRWSRQPGSSWTASASPLWWRRRRRWGQLPTAIRGGGAYSVPWVRNKGAKQATHARQAS